MRLRAWCARVSQGRRQSHGTKDHGFRAHPKPGIDPRSDRKNLRNMQRGREWVWIVGNHDPEPADGIGGSFTDVLSAGPLTFRHLPSGVSGEVSGHLHPVARISHRGRAVSRRCFAADKTRMVMPAFGAFTGGLNVRDSAFADLFGTLAFNAYLLGDGRLYSFTAKRCLPD